MTSYIHQAHSQNSFDFEDLLGILCYCVSLFILRLKFIFYLGIEELWKLKSGINLNTGKVFCISLCPSHAACKVPCATHLNIWLFW